MANRYYTSMPSRKISGKDLPSPKAGKVSAMPQKQAFTNLQLPGKAADGFAAAKKGYREVNGYAAWKGLSQSTADEYNRDRAAYRKAKSKMDEYYLQEDAGGIVVDNAKRNAKGDYELSGTKTPYEVDTRKLGRSDTPYGELYERKYGPKKR